VPVVEQTGRLINDVETREKNGEESFNSIPHGFLLAGIQFFFGSVPEHAVNKMFHFGIIPSQRK
jgi:hypothetical protein